MTTHLLAIILLIAATPVVAYLGFAYFREVGRTAAATGEEI